MDLPMAKTLPMTGIEEYQSYDQEIINKLFFHSDVTALAALSKLSEWNYFK